MDRTRGVSCPKRSGRRCARRAVPRRLFALMVLVVLTPAHAADRVASKALDCTTGVRSALSEVSCEIAAYIGASAPRSAMVACGPFSGDIQPERPEELATTLSSAVAGRLSPSFRAIQGTQSLGSARAAARSSGHLLYLRPRVAGGRLQVSFDLYPVPRSFWERVRNTSPSPIEHGFAQRRLDAEVATYLPPVRLVTSHLHRASADSRALALACGDADRNGSLSLLWVDRHKVQTARVGKRSLQPLDVARWSDLSAVAPAPLRQPIGLAAIDRHGLWVGLSDRQDGLLLDSQLKLVDRLPRLVPWPGLGCLSRGATGLAEPRPCKAGTATERRAPRGVIDAAASARIVGRAGTARHVFAWRNAETGVTHLLDDGGAHVEVGSTGAQLALGDVDRDGQPELVCSADTLDPAADALIVRTWRDDGGLVERYRLSVPTGVHALAVCPAEDSGPNPVAVGSGDGIWIVR